MTRAHHGISRSRVAALLGALVLVSCEVVAVAPRAGATTGLDKLVPVRVTLTDRGVTFRPRPRADTETTFEMKVVNRSSTPRAFRFGSHQTRVLAHGRAELFFYAFNVPGNVAWRSRATGGRTFFGRTPVALAKTISS